MGETYRFGLGAQWQVSPAISLGAAYALAWMGDMPVNQESLYRGRLSGSLRRCPVLVFHGQPDVEVLIHDR